MIDAPIAKRVDATTDDVPREERARLSGYRRRFAIIYLGLALVRRASGSARSSSSSPTATRRPRSSRRQWSELPARTARTNARAGAIAAHVSEGYRNAGRASSSSGAIAGPPRRRLEPAGGQHPGPDPRGRRPAGHSRRAVQIAEPRGRDRRHVEQRPVRAVRLGPGVLDRLRAAVRGASPPAPAREALELALYTFKYVGGVNSVDRLPPAAAGRRDAPRRSLFLRRGDLGAELARSR